MHSLLPHAHGTCVPFPQHGLTLPTRRHRHKSRWPAQTRSEGSVQLALSTRGVVASLLTSPPQAEEAHLDSHGQAKDSEEQRPADRRTTGTDTDDEYLFAFGSFMCPSCMLKRGVRVKYRDAAVIRDPSIKMVFKHKGGHATLERLPPGKSPRFPPLIATHGPTLSPRVHGVLYQVHKGDTQKVQSLARNDGFVLAPIEVETYDGSVQVTAQALVSGPLSHLLGDEVVPPEKYMRMLREGAADNFLDPVYQAWLSGIKTVSSAGLPPEYFNTPSRYISATFFVIALLLVGSTLSSFM